MNREKMGLSARSLALSLVALAGCLPSFTPGTPGTHTPGTDGTTTVIPGSGANAQALFVANVEPFVSTECAYCHASDQPSAGPKFLGATGAYYGQLVTDPRFVNNRDRVAHRAEFGEEAAALFRTHTTHEWLTRLHAEGVPAAPIQSVDQVLKDPQLRHRDMVVELAHPRHGVLPTLGTPIKFQPPTSFTPAPPASLGQHTDTILTELLTYPAARIEALRRAGAIR